MLFRFFVLIGFVALAASAQAQEPLGMVLDVQGSVSAADAGKASRVEMLSYLKPGMELDLAPGSSLTVTWYASSKEMKFSGPAKLKVAKEGIQGARANERSLGEEKVALGKNGMSGRLAQATIMMRSLGRAPEEALSPPKGAKLASLTPHLAWKGADDRNYRVVIEDLKGGTVLETVVRGNAADVPPQKLAYGGAYRWRAQFEPGATTAEGEFSLIGRAEAERLAKLKPGDNASFSDWVIYAMALEDVSATSEARPIWKKLAAERPEEPKLRQYADR